MADEYARYLETFMKNASWEAAMDRMERHCEMLARACRDIRPELLVLPMNDIKHDVHDITDNLDKSIGLPLDGYFEPEEFAPKLKILIEDAIKNWDLEDWKYWNPGGWEFYNKHPAPSVRELFSA